MKKVLLVLLISLIILVGWSGNGEIKQSIVFGKEYKEATYTINYKDLPDSSDAREVYIRTKAEPFLAQEELEDDSLYR
ncbi:hypothetical protein ACFQ3N_10935 [Virgibacillus byunsanensis]|uniref:DUF1093 domain-containing protein n=1 Tax=Virgibacillus byunsanensis TaxID=570945 RepID=A0ABW3LLT8_9BACI